MKALRLFGWLGRSEQATKNESPVTTHTRTIPAVPISASVRKLPYIKSHADYYRRLDNEPGFAAEMSEQQRRIGTY